MRTGLKNHLGALLAKRNLKGPGKHLWSKPGQAYLEKLELNAEAAEIRHQTLALRKKWRCSFDGEPTSQAGVATCPSTLPRYGPFRYNVPFFLSDRAFEWVKRFMPFRNVVVPRKTSVAVFALVVTVVVIAREYPSNRGLRLLFTGDILLSRQVEVELEHRKVSPWTDFADLFHGAEWVGGNFEGALGAESQCIRRKSPCFATPESAVQLLKDAGFGAVTIENNHAGDLGSAGREQTRTSFQQAGLIALDFGNSPEFLRFGETTVALIAITTVRAADGRVQQIPSIDVARKLRLARHLANVVVVSIHWGTERLSWPNSDQRKQASWLVEHGVDLIVGHHPHVVQPPACVEGKPVFFSLGNHVFDQKYPETKEGLIADCRLASGRLRCQGIRTHTERATSFPTLAGTYRATNAALAACTPKLRTASNYARMAPRN